MIFSHFKRRRGIRFDDGFRHSARELALDPLVATYDAILATDPTVPVLLQLTEYRGQQVLWQDPACTVPVEEIGDPIGGVRHPETGEILAVQETDANRPVWGGREVGAEFDESALDSATDDPFVTPGIDASYFALALDIPSDLNDNDQFVSQQNPDGPTHQFRWRNTGTYNSQIMCWNGAEQTVSAAPDFEGEASVALYRKDDGLRRSASYRSDGSVRGEASSNTDLDIADGPRTGIGYRIDNDDRYIRMNLRAAVFWDVATDEIEDATVPHLMRLL